MAVTHDGCNENSKCNACARKICRRRGDRERGEGRCDWRHRAAGEEGFRGPRRRSRLGERQTGGDADDARAPFGRTQVVMMSIMSYTPAGALRLPPCPPLLPSSASLSSDTFVSLNVTSGSSGTHRIAGSGPRRHRQHARTSLDPSYARFHLRVV